MSDDPTIESLAMRILGTYARLQTLIDEAIVKSFLEQRAPATANTLFKLAAKRITDSERPKLVRQIAQDCGSDAELSDFAHFYNEVKKLRDRLAHSPTQAVENGRLLLAGISGPEIDGSSEVQRSQLDTAVWQCDWLVAQVMYVAFASTLNGAVAINGKPIHYYPPTRLPADWDGVLFRLFPPNP